jgi:hypothetical protein
MKKYGGCMPEKIPFIGGSLYQTSIVALPVGEIVQTASDDVFCVASEGHAKHFVHKGVRPEKVTVTGIPNFDELHTILENDFPYRDFVLVATTPLRESLR